MSGYEDKTEAGAAGLDAAADADDLAFIVAVLDALPDHVYVKDREGRYLLVNRAGLRERGLSDLSQVVGRTARDFVPGEVAERMEAEDRAVMDSGRPLVNREAVTNFRGDGEQRWHITTKIPMRDPQGGVSGIVGINRDITDRKRVEIALRESEDTLHATFEQAAVGMTVMSLDLRFLRANAKFCEMLGYTLDELLQMHLTDTNPPDTREEAIEFRRRLVEGDVQGGELREKRLLRKDGSLMWVALATSVVRGGDGEPRCFISVIEDITERKQWQTELQQLAHYDVVTGLPNRALVYERLAQGLARAARRRSPLGLVFIDVDHFKKVNDTFGHAAGDKLLQEVSARLKQAVRAGDVVGRLGGDEFVVVLMDLAAANDPGAVAQRILRAMHRPFALEGGEVYATASVGVALYPDDSLDLDSLVRNADAAMYEAKKAGRDCFRYYKPEMNARAAHNLHLESELRRAFERDEFELRFQPKVGVASGEITGVEALLRWRHPERGLLNPAEFMHVLEETGLVVRAGAWVLDSVCRELKRWRSRGVRQVPVSVNISARQFRDANLAREIRAVLGRHGVEPGLLEIEITETSLMSGESQVVATLAELKSLGVRVAIDDFGTEYSSLSYLRRFPIDIVKIDRSFVSEIPENREDAAIARAIISMVHSLGLSVVAEGVETRGQLGFLAVLNCDEVQGFLFARPMPASEIEQWLAEGRRLAL